ncbi:MAG: hypothetical protein AAFZ92_06500, partial [Pseudomonadota bacterium]
RYIMKKIVLLMVFFGLYFPVHKAISNDYPDWYNPDYITSAGIPSVSTHSCQSYDFEVFRGLFQTFIAGHTGTLDKINIWMRGNTAETVQVYIYEDDSKSVLLYGTTPIGHSSIVNLNGAKDSFMPFIFGGRWDVTASTVQLTRGKEYTIHLLKTVGGPSSAKTALCLDDQNRGGLIRIKGSSPQIYADDLAMAYQVSTVYDPKHPDNINTRPLPLAPTSK